MPLFHGSYKHETRGDVEVEFAQRDGGLRWHVVVKNGMTRCEESTWAPSPWPTVARLIDSALDAGQPDDSAPRYDLNKKMPPRVSSTIKRRHGSLKDPGLGPWSPPET